MKPTDHRTFLERYYKNRRRAALYKLLVSAVLVLLFFNLAWYLPRNLERNIFSALAAVSVVIFFFESWSVFGNSLRALKFGKSYPPFIYEIGRGLAFFEEKDMQMCENLAAHGYMLVSAFFGLYKFERALPLECDFLMDISEVKVGDDGFYEYANRFEQGGWTYVCSTSALHFFRAPKNTKRMFTNSPGLGRKYAKMRNLCTWCVIAGAISALFGLFMAQLFPYPIATMFYLLAGIGFGISLAMSVGVVINQRLFKRLKGLQK